MKAIHRSLVMCSLILSGCAEYQMLTFREDKVHSGVTDNTIFLQASLQSNHFNCFDATDKSKRDSDFKVPHSPSRNGEYSAAIALAAVTVLSKIVINEVNAWMDKKAESFTSTYSNTVNVEKGNGLLNYDKMCVVLTKERNPISLKDTSNDSLIIFEINNNSGEYGTIKFNRINFNDAAAVTGSKEEEHKVSISTHITISGLNKDKKLTTYYDATIVHKNVKIDGKDVENIDSIQYPIFAPIPFGETPLSITVSVTEAGIGSEKYKTMKNDFATISDPLVDYIKSKIKDDSK